MSPARDAGTTWASRGNVWAPDNCQRHARVYQPASVHAPQAATASSPTFPGDAQSFPLPLRYRTSRVSMHACPAPAQRPCGSGHFQCHHRDVCGSGPWHSLSAAILAASFQAADWLSALAMICCLPLCPYTSQVSRPLADDERRFLFLGHEISQLLGRDVRPLVLVPNRFDRSRTGVSWFFDHDPHAARCSATRTGSARRRRAPRRN